MGKSPGIILTSQYTIPKQKSFTTYIDYCTRKQALLKDGHDLTSTELQELNRIEYAIDSYEMEMDSTSSNKGKKDISKKEGEAKAILTSPESFNTESDFVKYVSYMGRKYALESKKKMTKSETEELNLIDKHIQDLSPEKNKENQEIQNEAEEILPGVFSKDKNVITQHDLIDIKELMEKSQNSGSVYYQDVISFDTDFLVRNKLYDPETDILDENRIRIASHKMMQQLFKDEQIEESNGFWFASIHRNTDHIHIHFGTVEKENRRKVVKKEVNGKTYYEPKGKRKQKTLDHMKTTFANALVDRTSELSRISNLRNDLVQEVKEQFQQSKEKKQDRKLILLQEIYDGLPSNKKDWTYGSKKMPKKTRDKIDELTELLMKDNPIFKEYKEAVEKESDFQKELYGESDREDKDYAKNQLEDINKRMGNSLLKELKKKKPYEENPLYQFQRKNEQIKKKYERGRSKNKGGNYKYFQYKAPLIRKKDVRNIEAALNDDLSKWRAEREYELVQKRIARQQEMDY
ncbi:MobP2 family relaxase [Bacillus thuringiensis]|uniref:MobP2 family relaxase n=1 Tax=Bacillus thuringiensis TaxID=1428 RepID=UPI002DBC9884|nr:MobP2 family relaxase [Bacillus thuringiensis]MEC3226121.1 MobP2 family relaxase [Bacillus thuringiensis]MEC3463203.1 MobP2 family relaxase [Bacillus thuringiensis]MEC3555402.1 MobP2 family relaxase [Bacillus thuringiensis]MED2058887.1 MobP2 family relaxase [Bacillus thuringiensis]